MCLSVTHWLTHETWCREHGNMPREGEREKGRENEREGERNEHAVPGRERERESKKLWRERENEVRACVRAREAGSQRGRTSELLPSPSRAAASPRCSQVLLPDDWSHPPLLPPPTDPSSSSPAMRPEERKSNHGVLLLL